MWTHWVYRVIGGAAAGAAASPFDDVKTEIAISAVGASIPPALTEKVLIMTGRALVGTTRTVAVGTARSAWWITRSVTARVILPYAVAPAARATVGLARFAGAAVLGYAIGGVALMGISGLIWGDRGKSHASDFLLNRNNAWGNYFDVVGNVSTIWNAYFGTN